MSGLTDTTTGLTNGTGLYWHVGLDGGSGLNNTTTPAITNGLLLEDNVSFLLLEDNVSIILLEA
jgi:hypothetical protein